MKRRWDFFEKDDERRQARKGDPKTYGGWGKSAVTGFLVVWQLSLPKNLNDLFFL